MVRYRFIHNALDRLLMSTWPGSVLTECLEPFANFDMVVHRFRLNESRHLRKLLMLKKIGNSDLCDF